MVGTKYPANPMSIDSVPQITSNKPMPAPGPAPTSHAKTPGKPVPARAAGSRTKSASVPPIIGEMGFVTHAIRRRLEKTRPCKSGATLACQIAWLDPFTKAVTTEAIARPVIQMDKPPENPTIARPIPLIIQPNNTPWTRRLKPPHALINTPPTTPAIAPADSTEPSATVL